MEIEQFNTPILFMVFNRPDVTARVFEEIRKVRPKKLFISADGPRPTRPEDAEKCSKVREIVSRIDWPCEVHKLFHDSNLGCQIAPSSAVTWFFENVEAGIVLEDDCLPDPTFFPFCEELLIKYKDDTRVWQICGNFFQEKNKKLRLDGSYFFSTFPYLWGWASWSRSWKHYDLEMKEWPEASRTGELRKTLKDPAVYSYWENLWNKYYNGERNSWDRPWAFIFMLRGGLSINPNTNLISNIGFGAEATHTKETDAEVSNMKLKSIMFPLIHPKGIKANLQADAFAFRDQFGINKTLQQRLLSPIKRNFPNLFEKVKGLVK